MVMQRWETQSHGAWGKSVVLFVRIRTTGRRNLHMTRDRRPHRPRGLINLQTNFPHSRTPISPIPALLVEGAGGLARDGCDIL